MWQRCDFPAPLPLDSSQLCPGGYPTGALVATLMLPFSMPVCSVLSSACSEDGTLLAKSWNGASATAPLASVPVWLPPLNDPLAEDSTAFFTAAWMPLVTLVMKYLQYCWALMQPSVSTHSMLTFWLPGALSAPRTALA